MCCFVCVNHDVSVSRLKFWTGDGNQSNNLFLQHIFKQIIGVKADFQINAGKRKLCFKRRVVVVKIGLPCLYEFELGVTLPKLNSFIELVLKVNPQINLI